jgi:hypothetical protein
MALRATDAWAINTTSGQAITEVSSVPRRTVYCAGRVTQVTRDKVGRRHFLE